MYYVLKADPGHTRNTKGTEPMLRRHGLPMILTASALALAACSPSGSGNVTATDNSGVEALPNDGVSNETVANDELGTVDNAVAPDDLLGENAGAPNAAAAR